jgi:hypothetical protein
VTARRAPVVTAALVLALAVAGCGSGSSVSERQLRTAAGRVCGAATARLNRIPTPKLPSGEAAFLQRGIAALSPEVAVLAQLHPTGDLGQRYDRARTATQQQLTLLQSTVKGLKAGNDPVVAIKTLQTELVGPQRQAGQAWRELKIPACLDT